MSRENEEALDALRTMAEFNKLMLSIDSPYAQKVQEALAVVLNETIDSYIPTRTEFTEVQRHVLYRYYFGGQSLREIATAMNLNYDYVRSVNMGVRAKLGNLTMDDIKLAFDDAVEASKAWEE